MRCATSPRPSAPGPIRSMRCGACARLGIPTESRRRGRRGESRSRAGRPRRAAPTAERLGVLEEEDDLPDLLVREPDVEALIVEVHYVFERLGGAIVEVWRARAQAAQLRRLEFAEV